MPKRITIEVDEALVARAQRVIGSRTIRGTVEEALRLAANDPERSQAERADRQRKYLAALATHVDLSVLASGEAWRRS
jgi:Arc/MetJ family transcription regulator